jgi:hypothetical protein
MRNRRAARVALVAALVALLAPLQPGPGTAYAAADPVPKIDWRVPEHTPRDVNRDNVVDELNKWSIHNSPPLELVACGSQSDGSPIVRYQWKLTLPNGSVDRRDSASCRVSTNVPATNEATYPTELTVTTQDGRSATTAGYIRFRDYLIISIGDSLASGEGVPLYPSPTRDGLRLPAGWSDHRCHRSWHSGHARAAQAIAAADEHSRVTFISVACSGAGIVQGLLGPYNGIVPPPGTTAPLAPQLDQVVELLCPGAVAVCPKGQQRRIDGLLVNVGANDVKFGEIVERCAHPLYTPCHGNRNADWRRGIDTLFDALPGKYDQLAAALDSRVNVAGVHIGEYPDPTHDANGRYCEMVFDGPINGNISPGESQWAYESVVTKLLARIGQAAERHGWNRAGGLLEAFRNHGYCAADRWIVQYHESFDTQADKNGTMHPNVAGHLAVRDAFSASLRSMTAVPRFTGVWERATNGEIQVYPWPYETYRAHYDRIWSKGWRLEQLDTSVVNGQVRYTAVWQPSTAGEIQLYTAPYAEYRATYDRLWGQGWRLKLLDTVVVRGQVLYTAVWQPGNDGEVQLYGPRTRSTGPSTTGSGTRAGG